MTEEPAPPLPPAPGSLDSSHPCAELNGSAPTLLSTIALQNPIFNSANFSSIATDARGVIQIFNVGAERMLGYTALEVVNRLTPADISDPQEIIARARVLSAELGTPMAPGFQVLAFKASRGMEDICELTYIRKDGRRLPAVVSVTALCDAQDAIIGYLLIGTDNTARKLMEAKQAKLDQRLRDQQFHTRSLIESHIDAIMTTDPAGIITDVNRQMEALTDCTRDELIGAPLKTYFTVPEQLVAAMTLALSGRKIVNCELTVRARNGRETVVSYNATAFYDRQRVLQGVFSAARDFTQSKPADRVLQEKDIELQSARLSAEKANQARSDLLSRMSRGIRSPLNPIVAAEDAGMTQFSSKSLDAPPRISTIQRLTRHPTSDAARPDTHLEDLARKHFASTEAATGLPVIDVVQGLAIWGDLDVYRSYLQRFLQLYCTAGAVMYAHLQHGDRPVALATAHKLAGVAANLALPQLLHCVGEVAHALANQLEPTGPLAHLDAAMLLAVAAIDRLDNSTACATWT